MRSRVHTLVATGSRRVKLLSSSALHRESYSSPADQESARVTLLQQSAKEACLPNDDEIASVPLHIIALSRLPACEPNFNTC